MSTNDKKVNIYLKKFLTQQQITENFLEYLLKQIRDGFSEVWQSQGVFEPDINVTQILSSDTPDTFDIVTPLVGTNGPLGNILNLDAIDSNNIQFENENGVEYFVGLRFQEIPTDTEINVRTGEIKYTFIKERIGELSEPDVVTDDGDETLTIELNGIFEAGVSSAGRKVLVYLKNPVSQADTFEEATVIFSGGKNIIETTTALGQTLGNISTDPADYQVFAIGSTVRRNTNLTLDPNIIFIGKFDGGGAGNMPTNFNQDDVRNLSFGLAGVIDLFDVEHHLTDGTHADINPDTIVTKPAVEGIQLDTQVNVGDEDTPDAPIIHTLFPSTGGTGLQDAKWVLRDSAGVIQAFVDAHGNAYFQNLAAVDSIFKSNLTVDGNVILGNDIGADTTTFNSIQQSLTDMLYVIDSDNNGTNSYKWYNHSVTALNLLMELMDTGDIKLKGDVLTGNGNVYSKNSDLSPIQSDASLNEVFDETLSRKLLKTIPNNPGDKEIIISPSFVGLKDGSQYRLPNGPLLSEFAGTVLNMEDGTFVGGTVLPFTQVDFTGQADKFFKYSLNLLQSNEILIIPADSGNLLNFGTTLANTPNPPISEDAISFAVIAVQNDSGVSVTEIRAILEANITRIPVGGGGGGAGDASTILGRMEDVLNDSFYEYLEPNVISIDGEDKVDNTTGTFSVVTKTIDFDAAELLNSISLLDPEFLTQLDDVLKAQVMMTFDKDNVDSNPGVELTNNGVDFQAITMERLGNQNDTFIGELIFDLSTLVLQTLLEYAVVEADALLVLDATNNQARSQEFITTADTSVHEKLTFYINKLGAPTGRLRLNLHEDNAGNPGVVLSQSIVNIGDLAAGNNVVEVEIGRNVLDVTTKYHIQIESDDEYKATFNTGVDEVSARVDSTAPSIPASKTFDGAAYSSVAGNSFVYKIEGRKLDLKLRYTASEKCSLKGYGVFYGHEAESVQRLKRRNAFVFNGTIDNENEFQLTFDADPDFLEVQDRISGQVWGTPSFQLQNNKVVFPVDFFDGREVVHLIAKQVEGGSFDGNPELLKLVEENHLGSADVSIDRSVAGRGPQVRTENTAIRVELTVDENFNLVIKEA